MLNSVYAIEKTPDREAIEQVRNLLFGEIQREKIAAMVAESAAMHAQFVRNLGDAITELGHRIAGFADPSGRDVAGHE